MEEDFALPLPPSEAIINPTGSSHLCYGCEQKLSCVVHASCGHRHYCVECYRVQKQMRGQLRVYCAFRCPIKAGAGEDFDGSRCQLVSATIADTPNVDPTLTFDPVVYPYGYCILRQANLLPQDRVEEEHLLQSDEFRAVRERCFAALQGILIEPNAVHPLNAESRHVVMTGMEELIRARISGKIGEDVLIAMLDRVPPSDSESIIHDLMSIADLSTAIELHTSFTNSLSIIDYRARSLVKHFFTAQDTVGYGLRAAVAGAADATIVWKANLAWKAKLAAKEAEASYNSWLLISWFSPFHSRPSAFEMPLPARDLDVNLTLGLGNILVLAFLCGMEVYRWSDKEQGMSATKLAVNIGEHVVGCGAGIGGGVAGTAIGAGVVLQTASYGSGAFLLAICNLVGFCGSFDGASIKAVGGTIGGIIGGIIADYFARTAYRAATNFVAHKIITTSKLALVQEAAASFNITIGQDSYVQAKQKYRRTILLHHPDRCPVNEDAAIWNARAAKYIAHWNIVRKHYVEGNLIEQETFDAFGVLHVLQTFDKLMNVWTSVRSWFSHQAQFPIGMQGPETRVVEYKMYY